MRKIIISLHTSLDSFVAGPNGEMDWIKIDDELFDLVGKLTDEADTALYGRVTYEMMESYWPTAANKPNATKHDTEHSRWYSEVDKVVLSKTMNGIKKDKTTFIGDNIASAIDKLKKLPGKNIIIFGSPAASHSLMEYNLIDDYWLFINPIVLGKGISTFAGIKDKIDLNHVATEVLQSGVTALHYRVIR